MSILHDRSSRVNREAFAVRTEGACPRCGSTETAVIPCRGRKGPHDRERTCAGCGRHRGWAPKPRDPEEAARFEMPFGRHKGTPLSKLDDGYLEFLVRTCRSRSVADRAALVLYARRASR